MASATFFGVIRNYSLDADAKRLGEGCVELHLLHTQFMQDVIASIFRQRFLLDFCNERVRLL